MGWARIEVRATRGGFSEQGSGGREASDPRKGFSQMSAPLDRKRRTLSGRQYGETTQVKRRMPDCVGQWAEEV